MPRALSSSANSAASRPPTSTTPFSFCSSTKSSTPRICAAVVGVDEHRDLAAHDAPHRVPLDVRLVRRDAGGALGRARLLVGACVVERTCGSPRAPRRAPSPAPRRSAARTSRAAGVMFGQRTCSATGARTVMSSCVQPSRWTSADVRGSRRRPARRARSSRRSAASPAAGRESGLIITSARRFGFTFPVSCVSLLPSMVPTSIRPSMRVRGDEAGVDVLAAAVEDRRVRRARRVPRRRR